MFQFLHLINLVLQLLLELFTHYHLFQLSINILLFLQILIVLILHGIPFPLEFLIFLLLVLQFPFEFFDTRCLLRQGVLTRSHLGLDGVQLGLDVVPTLLESSILVSEFLLALIGLGEALL